MKETKIIMGMPVTVEIRDSLGNPGDGVNQVFQYLYAVDEKFSTYKENSEISRINKKELGADKASDDVKEVLALSEQTKHLSLGYFDILRPDGLVDPSGLVKGWAILKAAKILKEQGFENFYVDAGGDVQVSSPKGSEDRWKVGIRNPFNRNEIVKVVGLSDQGIATSGTYIRGEHIYNPHNPDMPLNDVLSVTVISENVYEADRFATAAFAMGLKGIEFIENFPGFEGYQIDKNGNALMTSGFDNYVIKD